MSKKKYRPKSSHTAYTSPYSYNPMLVNAQPPMNPQSDQIRNLVLSIILESITGEREDELFYDYLITQAPTQQEKQIIASIRDDERKHRRYFTNLYMLLTGTKPPMMQQQQETFTPPASYLAGIEKALLGELRAFERYRTLYIHIPEQYRDVVFEIMTDELKHAQYYNFLYTKNKR